MIESEKYLMTEGSGSASKVLKKLGFMKDVLIVIQDIYDLANVRIPDEEKEDIVDKNVRLIKHLMKKNNISEFYVDMVASGVQVALKHAGVKLSSKVRL